MTVWTIAVLHQHLEDLAGLLGEEHVVGHDDRGPSTGLEDRQDVLDEVELLVARLNDEVFTIGGLVGTLGAERRIREDDVVPLRRMAPRRSSPPSVMWGSTWWRYMFIRASRRGRATSS